MPFCLGSIYWNAGTPERVLSYKKSFFDENCSKCHKTCKKHKKSFYEKNCLSGLVPFTGTAERRNGYNHTKNNFLTKIVQNVMKHVKNTKYDFMKKMPFCLGSIYWNAGTGILIQKTIFDKNTQNYFMNKLPFWLDSIN